MSDRIADISTLRKKDLLYLRFQRLQWSPWHDWTIVRASLQECAGEEPEHLTAAGREYISKGMPAVTNFVTMHIT